MPHRRFVEAAAIRANRGIAIHEQIVFDAVIASAADEHGPVNFVKDIAEYLGPTHAVIHVDPHRPHADATGMVDKVVTDFVPPKRVVAPGVDRAHVAGLQRYVMDFVALNEMVIAPVKDGAVGVILDYVVRRA